MIGDDITTFLVRDDDPGFGFRQGTVLAFDPTTGENTIGVAGGTLTDLPLLNIGDTVNLTVGDVVVLMRLKSSWAILGRLMVPGGAALNATAVGFGSLGVSNLNFGLTTSYTVKASDLIEIPAWANRMLMHATADATVENTSAAADFAYLRIGIDSASGGSAFGAVSNAAGGHPDKYTHLAASAVTEIPVTGGDLHIVVAEMRSSVGSWAANAGNIVNLNAIAIFRKA